VDRIVGGSPSQGSEASYYFVEFGFDENNCVGLTITTLMETFD
jgi:hypothetical protein